MSYSVYIQKFKNGEPSPADFEEVLSVLCRYGSVSNYLGRLEFWPNDEDICEVGFLNGGEVLGITSISFERPIFGGCFAQLVFDLLGISGMCYFEQDCIYVLSKTDVTSDLPDGLAKICKDGRVTVISSVAEVPFEL